MQANFLGSRHFKLHKGKAAQVVWSRESPSRYSEECASLSDRQRWPVSMTSAALQGAQLAATSTSCCLKLRKQGLWFPRSASAAGQCSAFSKRLCYCAAFADFKISHRTTCQDLSPERVPTSSCQGYSPRGDKYSPQLKDA